MIASSNNVRSGTKQRRREHTVGYTESDAEQRPVESYMVASGHSSERIRPSAQPSVLPQRGPRSPQSSPTLSLGQRMRDWKTPVGFVLSAAIVVFFVVTAHLDLGAIWGHIRTADVRYLMLGLLVYWAAFVFRGLRWRFLLRRAGLGDGVRLPALGGIIEIIYLSWFVNCLVPAKLGDAYRAHLLSKHTGADMGRTLGTVVGERMADVLALVALLFASGVLVLGNLAGARQGGGATFQWVLLAGLAPVLGIGGAVAGLRLATGRLSQRLPARWRESFTRFAEGLLRTFQRDAQLPLYGLTGVIWACEALRIWLVLLSFHITGLSVGAIIFTALAGSLLSTIPFTPAGLGAVEGASVAILSAFGVAASLAGAVAVVDRVINYWSNIPLGGLLYIFSRRK